MCDGLHLQVMLPGEDRKECPICKGNLGAPSPAGERQCPDCDVAFAFDGDWSDDEKMPVGIYALDGNGDVVFKPARVLPYRGS